MIELNNEVLMSIMGGRNAAICKAILENRLKKEELRQNDESESVLDEEYEQAFKAAYEKYCL